MKGDNMNNELVFLESMKLDEVPFTTSLVISEFAQIEHRAVRQLINSYGSKLKNMGKVTFEMLPMPSGQKVKNYKLNEMQSTFLITLLKNTDQVVSFKEQLVHQFYTMKQELFERKMHRQQGKETRLSMTDAIKEYGFSSKFYIHFQNLAYKSAIGFNASQIRKARNVDKRSSPLDYLTSKEAKAINQREQQIATLITLGMDYEQIKGVLANGGVIYQTTLEMPVRELLEV